MWAIPTGTSSALKKNQVKSPSPESRVPEIGSDWDSGRDRPPWGGSSLGLQTV